MAGRYRVRYPVVTKITGRAVKFCWLSLAINPKARFTHSLYGYQSRSALNRADSDISTVKKVLPTVKKLTNKFSTRKRISYSQGSNPACGKISISVKSFSTSKIVIPRSRLSNNLKQFFMLCPFTKKFTTIILKISQKLCLIRMKT